MHKAQKLLAVILLFMFLAPVPAKANIYQGIQKTLTGTAVKMYDNQISIRTSSGAVYVAETSSAKLVRKYGQPMELKEVLLGDKLEVRGLVYGDNSMSARHVRNMSLYVHSGTFSGKIISLSPWDASLTMQSSAWGLQTVKTDNLTVFKKNSTSGSFADLQVGYPVTVKGSWERSRSSVAAREVKATVRMVHIAVTGTVVMVSPTALTVQSSDNMLYGIDIAKAALLDKNGRRISVHYFLPGQTVRVQGKHVSESLQVTASEVKNKSVTR
jgi:hypothetical protein